MAGHNTKLFEQRFTHNVVLIFNKLSGEIKNVESITKFLKNLVNFLEQKEFLHGGRIYYSGFSPSEL